MKQECYQWMHESAISFIGWNYDRKISRYDELLGSFDRGIETLTEMTRNETNPIVRGLLILHLDCKIEAIHHQAKSLGMDADLIYEYSQMRLNSAADDQYSSDEFSTPMEDYIKNLAKT